MNACGKELLVAHDPGHGAGPRPTGTCHGDLIERDWVLRMAEDLEAAVPWARHRLLRTIDVGPTYSDRAVDAEACGASLVLSHHVNAHVDTSLDGLMCFVAPDDQIGLEVGNAIMRAAPAELRRKKARSTLSRSGNWTRDAWSVLERYRARGIPVVLIEWGFATSPNDYGVLMSPASRPALCAAGAAGIARAFELIQHPVGSVA